MYLLCNTVIKQKQFIVIQNQKTLCQMQIQKNQFQKLLILAPLEKLYKKNILLLNQELLITLPQKFLNNNIQKNVIFGLVGSSCIHYCVGMIQQILIYLYLPFNGNDARTTQMLIEINKWSFDKNDWANISQEAKTFVKKLLTYNPDKRISAEEAYLDPWLQGHINNTIDSRALTRLQQFYQSHIIQELIRQFITFQVLTPEDKAKILGNFQSLDRDGDGKINREDLIFGLKQSKLDETEIEKQVDRIMEQCDFNKNGSIEYNAFLSIMIGQELSEKTNKLEEAFKQFDLDNDGLIKKQNLEDVLGGIIIDETHWEEVLKKCDSDQQGMISKENFVKLMQQL